MVTINRIPMHVTGNTGEIIYRTSRNGTLFANFSVCQQSRRPDQNGRWEDGPATWIRVVAVGALAEHMQQSGWTKGVRVTVSGWFEQRDYQDQNGQKHTMYELHADDIAASLQYATVQVNKIQTANGFAGRTMTAQQAAAPQQGGYQQQDYQYTDGYADANPQQPRI